MKFQDSSFNGLKVTVGTKSVTHPRTHAPTHAPKAICPINFFKVGGIIMVRIITEEFVTIGYGMRPTGKILTYLSGLSYIDTRNSQSIVIKKNIRNLY